MPSAIEDFAAAQAGAALKPEDYYRLLSPDVTIMSIVPWTIKTYGRHIWELGPQEFVFKGVKPTDKPPYELIRLQSGWEPAMDLTEPENMVFIQRPKPAIVKARAIIEDLTGNIMENEQDATLGIGLIKGEKPTEREFKELTEKQARFFMGLVGQADRFHISGNTMQKMRLGNAIYRRSLLWLIETGRDTQERHGWYSTPSAEGMKPCPACGENILASAMICRYCSKDLAEFYFQEGLVAPEHDSKVYAKWQRLSKAKKSAGAAPALQV